MNNFKEGQDLKNKINIARTENIKFTLGTKKLIAQYSAKLELLKQTLTEIKEIAENGKRFAERYMITGEQKANVLTYANAILQKISEYEVEE